MKTGIPCAFLLCSMRGKRKRPCKCKADFFYVWNNLSMQMYFQTLPQAHLRLTSFIFLRLSGDSSSHLNCRNRKQKLKKNYNNIKKEKWTTYKRLKWQPSPFLYFRECILAVRRNWNQYIATHIFPIIYCWRQQNMTYNVTYLTCEPMKPRVISGSSTDFVLYTMSRLLFHGREALAYVSLSSRPIFYWTHSICQIT